MLQRVVVASRYLMLPVVACLAVAMVTVFVHGAALTGELVRQTAVRGVDATATKSILLDVIELVDVFLVGATLYVILIGLYGLFIDPRLPLLPWLIIKTLDDLKAKVLLMVIVVLGVFFLGQVVAWDGTRDLLPLGAAIALVVAALTFFLAVTRAKPGKDESSTPK
ncbi:MAG: YqhA family protein [Chloroflexi bacterium]|nr:YqhA family protein [Chloroflexota bacterium]